MDGVNYREAVRRQERGVREDWIRHVFEQYVKNEIFYVREGGDNLGVSLKAKELAAEYGIDYRSPVFAIHKNGHYGSIVGYGFDTMKEYAVLVRKAADQGADFIKIMTTGLMDFKHGGRVTGSALSLSEVKEMVHIAHEEGFSVMSHTNGDQAVRDAIESGVDSIEHGNYISEDTVRMLADSSSLWVPTVVTVYNLIGDGRYEDEVLKKIWEKEAENLQAAWSTVRRSFWEVTAALTGYCTGRVWWMSTGLFRRYSVRGRIWIDGFEKTRKSFRDVSGEARAQRGRREDAPHRKLQTVVSICSSKTG